MPISTPWTLRAFRRGLIRLCGTGGTRAALTPLLLASALAACGCSGPGTSAQGVPAAPPATLKLAFSSTVSGDSALPETCKAKASEDFPQIVVHPIDPQILSVIYLQDGTRAAVGAASADGGASWWRAPILDASACSGGPAGRKRLLNPLLGSGADATVYYGNSSGHVVAHAALDAAGEWGSGVSPGQESDEDGSENLNLLGDATVPGKVTAFWTHFDYPLPPPYPVPQTTELRTAVSGDRGQTFSTPQTVVTSPPGRLIVNSRLARSSDGAMLACYDSVFIPDFVNNFTLERTTFDLHCIRSLDGQQWSAPAAAGTSIFLPLLDPEAQGIPGVDQPIAYSAKFDLATGPQGLAALVHADLDENGHGLLRLAQSADGGASWSEPVTVISREAAVFEPAVAIGPDGTLGLFWYDWSRDETGDAPLSTDAWFAYSADRGASWEIIHLAGPFDLRASYDAELQYDAGALGAYQDLVALADGFGVVFTVGPPLATDGLTDVRFVRLQR